MIGVFKSEDKLGKRLIIILKGFPCAYGKCSFCPFVLEQTVSTGEVLYTNRKIISEALHERKRFNPERIAVFNGGSFHELPFDTIEALKPLAENVVFEIEERSEYVTLDSLTSILDLLKPRKLVVRIGFETFSEEIREKLLRKGMPNTELERIIRLRNELRKRRIPVEIWTYLLFGMKGISEESVITSMRKFREYFDGVIAVRYQKYLPNHPDPVPVSDQLRKFLEENADLVDWGGDQWIIAGKKGFAQK